MHACSLRTFSCFFFGLGWCFSPSWLDLNRWEQLLVGNMETNGSELKSLGECFIFCLSDPSRLKTTWKQLEIAKFARWKHKNNWFVLVYHFPLLICSPVKFHVVAFAPCLFSIRFTVFRLGFVLRFQRDGYIFRMTPNQNEVALWCFPNLCGELHFDTAREITWKFTLSLLLLRTIK